MKKTFYWLDYLLLGVVFVYLLLVASVMPVNFDEACHLQVPLSLARQGQYDTVYHIRPFDGFITFTVGPTVQLPIALAFKIFDIGVTQARFTRFLYVAVMIGLFWAACAKTCGRIIGVALLLIWYSIPYQLPYTLWVLGEVPAICFVWVGMMLWARDSVKYQNVSIFLMGFSVVTKQYFGMVLLPLVILITIRAMQRRAPIRSLLKEILIASALFLAPSALWEVAKWLYLGPSVYPTYLSQHIDFLRAYQLDVDDVGILDRVRVLSDNVFPPINYWITVTMVVGIAATGMADMLRGVKDEHIPSAFALLVFLTAYAWFVFFAPLAWWRYLFGFTTLFLFLLGGLVRRILGLLPDRFSYAAGAVLCILLVLFVLPGVRSQHEATRAYPEEQREQRAFASQVRSYIEQGYAIGVEGWWQAPEISFLSGGAEFFRFACGAPHPLKSLVIYTKMEEIFAWRDAAMLKRCLGQKVLESTNHNYSLYVPRW